jgi:hypothetical protein
MQVSIYKQLSCLSFLELIFFSFYFGLNFLHCILYHTNKPGSTGLDRYSCICHIKTGNRENAPCRCQKLMPISLFPCTSLRHFVEQNKGENARALQAWAVELHINVGPILSHEFVEPTLLISYTIADPQILIHHRWQTRFLCASERRVKGSR